MNDTELRCLMNLMSSNYNPSKQPLNIISTQEQTSSNLNLVDDIDVDLILSGKRFQKDFNSKEFKSVLVEENKDSQNDKNIVLNNEYTFKHFKEVFINK